MAAVPSPEAQYTPRGGLTTASHATSVVNRRVKEETKGIFPMRKPIRKAVLPVAGLGTRFLPATKAVPKEMLTVVDRPILQHVVDEARAAGIEKFISSLDATRALSRTISISPTNSTTRCAAAANCNRSRR